MDRSWPLFLLAAIIGCGDVRTLSPPDAAGSGEDSDAAPEPPGLVTVQIDGQFDESTYGEPQGGLPVLFFGPDHELIAEEETDDDGAASATVPPGSVVLILAEIEADEHAILGVFDVQPGDEIVFASPEPEPPAGVVMDGMTIDMPDSADKALSYYRADNGCGSNTSPADTSSVTLSFDPTCLHDGEFDVVVRAFDGQDNVLEAGSGHFTYEGLGAVEVPTWNGTQDLELPVTGIPTELSTMTVFATPTIGPLGFGSVMSDTIEPDTDSVDISLGAIDAFGDSLDVSIDYRPIQMTLARQRAYYRLEAGTADLPLPLTTELLPWYGRAVLSSATRTVSWTRTESGGPPDAQYVYLFGETKSAGTTGMLAVVPPGWTSVTVPELPGEYSDFDIDGYAQVITFIHAIETSGYDGYQIRTAGILPFLWSFDDFPRDPDVGFHLKISGSVIK